MTEEQKKTMDRLKELEDAVEKGRSGLLKILGQHPIPPSVVPKIVDGLYEISQQFAPNQASEMKLAWGQMLEELLAVRTMEDEEAAQRRNEAMGGGILHVYDLFTPPLGMTVSAAKESIITRGNFKALFSDKAVALFEKSWDRSRNTTVLEYEDQGERMVAYCQYLGIHVPHEQRGYFSVAAEHLVGIINKLVDKGWVEAALMPLFCIDLAKQIGGDLSGLGYEPNGLAILSYLHMRPSFDDLKKSEFGAYFCEEGRTPTLEWPVK